MIFMRGEVIYRWATIWHALPYANNRVSTLANFGICRLRSFGSSCDQTDEVTNQKCGGRAYRDVPGPGDMRSPDVEVQSEPADHPDDGSGLCGAFREQAKQKHAQQPSIGNRSDAQFDRTLLMSLVFSFSY